MVEMDSTQIVLLIFAVLSFLGEGMLGVLMFLWKKSDKYQEEYIMSCFGSLHDRLEDQKEVLSNTNDLIKTQMDRLLETETKLAIVSTQLERFVKKSECANLREEYLYKK